ncbi:MAG: transcription antitermination factor NusB, partial [Acidihalobacter sp.]
MAELMEQGSARSLSQARHAARRVALQALYQWQLTGDSPKDILAQFREERPLKGAELDYFRELTLGVPEALAQLDAA